MTLTSIRLGAADLAYQLPPVRDRGILPYDDGYAYNFVLDIHCPGPPRPARRSAHGSASIVYRLSMVLLYGHAGRLMARSAFRLSRRGQRTRRLPTAGCRRSSWCAPGATGGGIVALR